MRYIAKIQEYGVTRYGYGKTDHEAVAGAVRAHGGYLSNAAWLHVYTEDDAGNVGSSYGMPFFKYRLDTE